MVEERCGEDPGVRGGGDDVFFKACTLSLRCRSGARGIDRGSSYHVHILENEIWFRAMAQMAAAVLCGWRREQAPAVSSDEARELYLKLSVTFVYIVRLYRSNFAGAG